MIPVAGPGKATFSVAGAGALGFSTFFDSGATFAFGGMVAFWLLAGCAGAGDGAELVKGVPAEAGLLCSAAAFCVAGLVEISVAGFRF